MLPPTAPGEPTARGATPPARDSASPAAGGTAPRPWLPLRFSGRIGRVELLVYVVGWHVVCAGIGGVLLTVYAFTSSLLAGGATTGTAPVLIGLVGFLVYALGVASYAVRRLHDIGWSPLWVLLGVVPVLNLALAGIVLLAPGSSGENAHGARAAGRVTFEPISVAAEPDLPSVEEAREAGRRFAERQRG
jgi:uncharacterized membrane protein YhaH (DUF805 family)